jgi:hypothetical protein
MRRTNVRVVEPPPPSPALRLVAKIDEGQRAAERRRAHGLTAANLQQPGATARRRPMPRPSSGLFSDQCQRGRNANLILAGAVCPASLRLRPAVRRESRSTCSTRRISPSWASASSRKRTTAAILLAISFRLRHIREVPVGLQSQSRNRRLACPRGDDGAELAAAERAFSAWVRRSAP